MVLVVAFLLAGCAGGARPGRSVDSTTTTSAVPTVTSTAPTSPPTSPTTTTTTEPSLRDQVVAAHEAYEAAYTVCAANPERAICRRL